MTRRRYWLIQFVMVALLAILFALPHAIHAVRNHHQGLLRIISTDDGFYQAHVRAALLGRFDEVTNGMTGVAKGAAPALLELITGAAFSWTTLKAPQVMMLLTIFLTPFIVMLLAGLLRTLFKSERLALIGTAIYLIVFLGTLQKPVNMSLSLPFTILILWMLVKIHHARAWQIGFVIATGILLGILPWTYFWSWTFVWATGGMLLILDLMFSPRSIEKRQRLIRLFSALALGFIIAIPFFAHLYTSAHEPFFAETALRSTLIHSRGVESVPRTIVLLALVITSIILVRRIPNPNPITWLFPLAALLAITLCMYQNLIHGVILTFSSHYYPFVCLAALMIGMWAYSMMPHPGTGASGLFVLSSTPPWVRDIGLRVLIITFASIFLLAGLYDYRSSWDIIRGDYYIRNVQHLRPAVEFLDDDRRETVLTDRTTAHMVTTWTDDDVLFTAYVKHLVMSDAEYAERYCLTEIFTPGGPDIDWLVREVMERPDDKEFTRRKKQFTDVCAPIRRSPDQYLKKYNITKLLWNEKLRPEWKIDQVKFKKIAGGEGWSVWEII